MKTAARTSLPRVPRSTPVPLRVVHLPMPATAAMPGQGQRLFLLFRPELMRASGGPHPPPSKGPTNA